MLWEPYFTIYVDDFNYEIWEYHFNILISVFCIGGSSGVQLQYSCTNTVYTMPPYHLINYSPHWFCLSWCWGYKESTCFSPGPDRWTQKIATTTHIWLHTGTILTIHCAVNESCLLVVVLPLLDPARGTEYDQSCVHIAYGKWSSDNKTCSADRVSGHQRRKLVYVLIHCTACTVLQCALPAS